MRCPECGCWIPEQKVYLMSQRTPKGDPLTDQARRIRFIGLCVISTLVLSFVFHLLGV